MLPFPKSADKRTRELVGFFAHGSREHRTAVRDCTTCHPKDERPVVAIVASGDKDFVPVAGTFRNLPSGHASCFANCHWDKDKPTKDQCEGCHFPQAVLDGKKRDARSPLAAAWFKNWPRGWPSRLSLKFSHESKNHRESDNPELTCTTCHGSIKRSDKLEIPDVPITTCAASGCHFERASRTSIRKEMLAEEEDIAEGRDNDLASTTGQHSCTGCHTAAIGSAPAPCSHLRLFGDKYFDSAAYPNSGTQLLRRCPK
jgi:hypothetical protein